MTMTSLLATITEVFTSAVGWVGTVAGTIADEPLLLIGCVMGFVGVGVGHVHAETFGVAEYAEHGKPVFAHGNELIVEHDQL